jgi:hypothetical protein
LSELAPRKRQHENDEDFPFVQIALGLAFVFGAVVFAFLSAPRTLIPAFASLIPAAGLLGSALNDIVQRRRALSLPANRERELLTAIRDNGGSITAAEAAVGTTLTVGEADRMLSELASGVTCAWVVTKGRCFTSSRSVVPRARRPRPVGWARVERGLGSIPSRLKKVRSPRFKSGMLHKNLTPRENCRSASVPVAEVVRKMRECRPWC